MQKQVGRYLTSVSVLLILWFSFRTVKYFIFWQPGVIRCLWYLFYLPMLFVPMLALLIAMSLGRLDDYRLPKWTLALWFISGALLLLVMTNDLHQLVFTFPEDAAVWSDIEHGYGIGYFPVIGWQVLCGIAALAVMLLQCRLKSGKRRLWPATPMAVSLTYLALNYLGVPWLKALFGDVTAFQSCQYMLCFEACIACGYAVWTENVSALLKIKEESESLAEELAERNDILRYEYKREAKQRKVEEQNRLYDLLQSATQTQLDRTAMLTQEYRQCSDSKRDRMLLAEIAVLCSYIKRRKHLTLLADRGCKLPVTELERTFSESLQTLELLGVRSVLYMGEELSALSGETAAAIFDFYESVIQADLENLTSVQVSLTDAKGLRLSLHVRCKAELSTLAAHAKVRYEADGDERHLVFLPEGGAVK